MKITTIGIDLAKAVFQLHGVDAQPAHPIRGSDNVRKRSPNVRVQSLPFVIMKRMFGKLGASMYVFPAPSGLPDQRHP